MCSRGTNLLDLLGKLKKCKVVNIFFIMVKHTFLQFTYSSVTLSRFKEEFLKKFYIKPGTVKFWRIQNSQFLG